ncbi:MAG: SGNH/GDSL hydrolase family protein [Deltaproteobacteria bacterium]|nr:SGNH/GDSL hydrolase family protein [Deltaproteobacteria bacterium]
MFDSGSLFWLIFLGTYVVCVWALIALSRKHRSPRVAGLLIATCSLLTLFGIAEVAFRIRHLYWRDIPWFSGMAWSDDQELGWAGTLVEPPSASGKKILFLGDSFTAGMGVAMQDMYYAVSARELGASAYAYAAPGYGTWQEALALRRLIGQIEPELIVLQVCSNDLINNYWQLERDSLHQRVLRPRPYWENGVSVQHMPRSGGWIRLFLAQHSRVFHFIFIHEEKLMLRLAKLGWASSIEDKMNADPNLPALQEARMVTEEILLQMKSFAGNVPIIAFMVDEAEPALGILKKAFAAVDIPLHESGIKALRRASQKETFAAFRLEDGVHLNAMGNAVFGKAIAKTIARSESSEPR